MRESEMFGAEMDPNVNLWEGKNIYMKVVQKFSLNIHNTKN